ncbi:MAG TPA: ribosome rescue GTPase HflX [Steroidobacteraceae bacterium]|jgi:GTP-binding protein HflX|nr:ribosome rescue GTPase HflX [Steroidobacteraceae bacterium]
MFERPRAGERAVLVRLGLGDPVRPEDLEEFARLARSADAIPVATITGRRERPDPRYFVGSGKAEEIASTAREHQAEVILVDHPLSPSQERNLEKLAGVRVIDRSGLILDIFAQRARSFEGKLEVELAQLKHLSSRLVRGWTHLERQKGGIGMRGPGETQLETDRRLLGARVKSLTRRLERLKQQRDTGRSARAEIPVPSVALVGYTNAGKSTLFRALTGSDVYIADQLFATLDPTVRRLRLPGGSPVVLADTVGFIRDLPHELVAAFQSTLQEAREAHLLLHVVDANDPQRDEHIHEVDSVLAEIGAGDIPQLRVYNKIDRLQLVPHVERSADGRPGASWISAAARNPAEAGLELLRQAIVERLELKVRRLWLRLPLAAGAQRAKLFAAGVVRDERTLPTGELELLVEMPAADAEAWAREPGVRVLEIIPASLSAVPIPAACTDEGPYLESPAPPTGARVRH